MKVLIGNIAIIEGIKYEVIGLINEVDFADAKQNKFFGEHLEVALHKIGDKAMHPTNYLYIYKDDPLKILFSGEDMCLDKRRKILARDVRIKPK